MADHRHEIRINCDKECLLKFGHLHDSVAVKNISAGGALVHFYLQPSLHIGDKCFIHIEGESQREYLCEVLRVEAFDVALRFIGIQNPIVHSKFFKYVDEIATKMDTPLSKVTFEDGQQVGEVNTFVLKLAAEGHEVTVLVYQSELDYLMNDNHCKPLDTKISMALLRLQSFSKNRGDVVASHRLHKRLYCEEKCILNLKDCFYSGVIKNISLGGALMHSNGPLPDVHVGETCKVSVNGKLISDYICEVVRVESPNIALRFIEMDIPKVVVH